MSVNPNAFPRQSPKPRGLDPDDLEPGLEDIYPWMLPFNDPFWQPQMPWHPNWGERKKRRRDGPIDEFLERDNVWA